MVKFDKTLKPCVFELHVKANSVDNLSIVRSYQLVACHQFWILSYMPVFIRIDDIFSEVK